MAAADIGAILKIKLYEPLGSIIKWWLVKNEAERI